jgi:hypothetical protein
MDPAERIAEMKRHSPPPKKDYLKWWRLVRRWAKAKSGLSLTDIELLLYLRGIPYFDQHDFEQYCKIISFDYRKLFWLRQSGWIQIWRKRSGKQKTIYELSRKSKNLVDQMYAYLEGELMPEHAPANPLYMKDSTYTERTSRIMVEARNKEIRERQQRLARQSPHTAHHQ